jgi:hypothetical protein
MVTSRQQKALQTRHQSMHASSQLIDEMTTNCTRFSALGYAIEGLVAASARRWVLNLSDFDA